MRNLLVGVIALFLASAPVVGAEVSVTVLLHQENPAASPGPLQGALLVRPQGDTEVTRLPVESLDPLQLSLAEDTIWTFQAEISGWWAPPAVLVPITGDRSVRLDLWPTTVLTGSVVAPVTEKLPTSLGARFRSDRIEEGLVDCPIRPDGAWSCELPADALDVRLRATGFVSHFLWDLDLRDRKLRKAGALRLERGASVVGRVAPADGGELGADCAVSLSPAQGAELPDPRQTHRLRSLRHERKCGPDGFFHFTGLSAGGYQVVAEQPGSAPVRIQPLRVMENAETEIREPLVLQPPATLEVALTPAADFFGRPWSVELIRLSEIVGAGDLSATGPVSEDGVFRARALNPGQYMVQVLDTERNSVLSAVETVGGGDQQIFLDIPTIWVEGTLELGGDPVLGEVWFGGKFGAERIKLPTDAEGYFTGTLPRAGTWPVYIEAAHPPIHKHYGKVTVRRRSGQRAARVDIDLPDTTVRGEVVDRHGEPVPGAYVRLYEPKGDRAAVEASDEDGAFEFNGTDEGLLRVQAETQTAASSQIQVMVGSKTDTPEVRLVLEDFRRVTGRVLAADGRPIPAAQVTAQTYVGAGQYFGSQRVATTDVTGTFDLKIPAEATHVQLTAAPAGHTLIVRPTTAVSSEPVTLLSEAASGAVTLSLETPIPWYEPGAAKPILYVGGTVVPWGQLGHWIRVSDPTARLTGTELTIPNLPVGYHTVCLQTTYAGTDLRALRPVERGCAEVRVTPSGEEIVHLKVPGLSKTSASSPSSP